MANGSFLERAELTHPDSNEKRFAGDSRVSVVVHDAGIETRP